MSLAHRLKRVRARTPTTSIAVAGFAGEDLSIEVKENMLTMRGNKQSNGEKESGLIYLGIPGV
jgi:molecular chaperone IbpA